jgi:hypothetical protein
VRTAKSFQKMVGFCSRKILLGRRKPVKICLPGRFVETDAGSAQVTALVSLSDGDSKDGGREKLLIYPVLEQMAGSSGY